MHTDGAVVLLSAAYLVREILRGRDVIKLSRGKVFRGPGRAAIDRDVGAAVVAIDHPQWIVRIDPEIVVVTVGHADRAIGLAAIKRFVKAGIQNVERVAVFWVSENVCVVERALSQSPVLAYFGPGSSGIIRTEHTTILVLYDRINTFRISARDGHADTAIDSLWQAFVPSNFGPGVAAVN